ncbi:MAG: hypothetical protein KAR05_00125 [Candidatus Omnitrophica bacterium]|nr:hypothetical protein [Candidatus Omnitrophota bacterium]MCK5591502.1 hypothetical protein [Candidatus Paceibacterota bacterium]
MSTEYKQSVHSDILIHWTGKDIDDSDPDLKDKEVPYRENALRPVEQSLIIKSVSTIKAYLFRLKTILKFGIWVVDDDSLADIKKSVDHGKRVSKDDGRQYETPNVARACFTELKLSEVRRHAFEYGCLGFGLKRFYLIDRGGQPLVYSKVGTRYKNKPNWFAGNDGKLTEEQKSFFKFMSESEDLNYKYYSESEWRIVCPHDFEKNCSTLSSIQKYFINVNGDLSEEVKKYDNKVSLKELEMYLSNKKINKLKYLMPMDYWLSVIVYPAPVIKIIAENDREIRALIRKLKSPVAEKLWEEMTDEEIERIKNQVGVVGEPLMMPMEIDLDTIGHF